MRGLLLHLGQGHALDAVDKAMGNSALRSQQQFVNDHVIVLLSIQEPKVEHIIHIGIDAYEPEEELSAFLHRHLLCLWTWSMVHGAW